MSGLKLFEERKVRRYYDTDKETWYFSVIDVIEILTGSSIPKRYWSDLKKKLVAEGSGSQPRVLTGQEKTGKTWLERKVDTAKNDRKRVTN